MQTARSIEAAPVDPRDCPIAAAIAADQPPLAGRTTGILHAAIASLALGGAERIVLDWAGIAARRYRVRLIVLRAAAAEWPLPDAVEVVRLDPANPQAALELQGRAIRASGNPVVLCHLLTAAERDRLRRAGATPIPVIHNAAAGWLEPAAALFDEPLVIAVSAAAAGELRAAGVRRVGVIRHIPKVGAPDPHARAAWRAQWQLPCNAFVIGMVGAIKPQKAYPRALHVLSALLAHRNAWLVILGDAIGKDGAVARDALLAQARRLDLCERIRLPGFVADATRVLPAFDCVLNTSRYEGLSIATLEALAAGLPVVATAVGGQGEIDAPGLRLLDAGAPPANFATAIQAATGSAPAPPRWRTFPAARVWTTMHLPIPAERDPPVLFVTANLNAGGAQRSLVNLALALRGRLVFSIAVCGLSTSATFTSMLNAAGIRVERTADSRDCFDHAEALLDLVAARSAGTVIFWNVDAKVKLLVAKRLVHTPLRVIDVCPGDYAFEEMDAIADFQAWSAYDARSYYAGLHRLVLKYSGMAPPTARTCIIPNGVSPAAAPVFGRTLRPRRVVVSGRIAPTKFLFEIAAAMQIVWRTMQDAELHVIGVAEPRHRDYAQSLMRSLAAQSGRRVFFHGPVPDAPRRIADFDIALVLGHHQGSPNAVLEAMAAGLPVIANDSGGTRELVIDRRTGRLLADREPATIAAALVELMNDGDRARSYARRGYRHVARSFSMRAMADAYHRIITR